MPFEIEEPEPVEASHLIRVSCAGGCGSVTLAVAEHLHDARCGPCLQAKIGSPGGQASGAVPVGPVRARWEVEERPREESRERSLHPEPEVRGQWGKAMPDMAPTPVLKLAELAREASWEVRVSYARGWGVHGSTGRPTALRHSIAIAFGRHPMTDAQAVATYVKPVSGGTWSWESIWLWGPELKHFGLCSLADLQRWLQEAGAPYDFAAVRARVAGAEAAKSAREERKKLTKALHREGVCAEELARYFEVDLDEVLKIVAPARGKKDHGD